MFNLTVDGDPLEVSDHTETVWFKLQKYGASKIEIRNGIKTLMLPSRETVHTLPSIVNVHVNARVIQFVRGEVDFRNQFAKYKSDDSDFPSMIIFSTK